MPEIEERPFPPFLPPKAVVMMMGTFPPKAEKRTMEFHYPNFQNDMWRVHGLIFFADPQHFQKKDEKAFDAEKIKAFLTAKGIASCPTVRRAIREHNNASDQFLEVVETVDLAAVLKKIPRCRQIGTTGGKATEILFGILGLKFKDFHLGETTKTEYNGRELSITRLPSTSRAYPMKLAKKAEYYRAFFTAAGVL